VQWFDGQHLARSPAQWDAAKLNWVNAQYLRALDDGALAALVAQQLQRHHALDAADERLPRICALFKDRCDTTVALAQWAAGFYAPVQPPAGELEKHVTPAVLPAVQLLAARLADCAWDKAAIAACIKQVLAECSLKMPQLAMAVRVLLLGTSQTPSLDAVIELFLKDVVVRRLESAKL
jgi:glutamyl-tRNA synthetase